MPSNRTKMMQRMERRNRPARIEPHKLAFADQWKMMTGDQKERYARECRAYRLSERIDNLRKRIRILQSSPRTSDSFMLMVDLCVQIDKFQKELDSVMVET